MCHISAISKPIVFKFDILLLQTQLNILNHKKKKKKKTLLNSQLMLLKCLGGVYTLLPYLPQKVNALWMLVKCLLQKHLWTLNTYSETLNKQNCEHHFCLTFVCIWTSYKHLLSSNVLWMLLDYTWKL